MTTASIEQAQATHELEQAINKLLLIIGTDDLDLRRLLLKTRATSREAIGEDRS